MSTETSSVYNKFKKLKLSLKKRSKNLKNEVESRDTTRKRASVGNRMSRSAVEDGVPGMKRKRIYADQGSGEERTHLRDRDNNKDSFKKGNNRFKENENDSFRKGGNLPFREKQNDSYKKGSNRFRENENDSFKKGSNRFRENENDSFKKGSNRFRENENDSFKKGSNRFRENENDSFKKGSNRFRENENDSFKKGSNRFRENERSKEKDSLKGDSNIDKNESIEDKFSKSHRTMWVPNKKENGALESKQPYTKGRGTLGNAKSTFGKLKTEWKLVERRKSVEVDSGHNLSRKKFAESNSDSSKRFTQGRSKSSDVSLVKSWKKTAHHKKILDDDSSLTDDQPRKRKRIRLDPHDTSNKRLEDSVVINERRIKEKKEELEQDDKLSMNAQFRAIQPSPSILSFVEDNLLGRRRLIELRRAGYNIELPAPLDNIPSTSSERERIGENLFRNKLSFFAAAKVSSSFPPPEIPEIAFAGRSNVGKSSLLNSLTRQWGVVRTSDKPGLTQTINFFNLGPKVCLVDLPGYGFAYAKEEVKDAWEELVKEYVSTRIGLRQVCLLIDTKWGMKPRDHELIDLMERFQTKYQIVLTKTDTVFPIDVARRAMQIEESLKANKSIVQPVMMVSSKSGAGIQSLRTVLTKIARFAKL